ncbi:CLIP domain-containing serine protease HP8-like [Vespula maculifrons]|uniref:CLIP domain-containing serine protease n=1 Tax=Vespula maculifrons TaxID=7453 RepID=A0ABD2C9K3_VESMC
MYSFVAVIAIFYVSKFSIVDAQFQRQSDCNTPNQVAGNCITIRQCIPLLTMLQEKPLRTETVDYLTRSQCGFEGKDPRVCCPLSFDESNQPSYPRTVSPTEETRAGLERTEDPISNLLNNPLLPSECGKSLIPRIIGGTRTALDEFPWMTLLEYQHPRGRTTACGGVLINERYVLTAAHCLKGKDLPKTWTLTSVRLGEYDTSSEKDCIQEEDEVICSDDPITVGIEEQIVHEQYRPLSKDQKYDIALLRLSRNIVSTKYIKPICLPRTPSFGQKMYVAGWGKTEFNSSSDFKLKLALPLTDKNDCDRTYDQVGIRLGFGQICAGGQKGKDSCRGDSGGPLMSIENLPNGDGIWVTVGVVSFGPTPCGMPGWPGVYTKVYDFVPWITSKIRS